jgi:hypothetical protein
MSSSNSVRPRGLDCNSPAHTGRDREGEKESRISASAAALCQVSLLQVAYFNRFFYSSGFFACASRVPDRTGSPHKGLLFWLSIERSEREGFQSTRWVYAVSSYCGMHAHERADTLICISDHPKNKCHPRDDLIHSYMQCNAFIVMIWCCVQNSNRMYTHQLHQLPHPVWFTAVLLNKRWIFMLTIMLHT